MKKGTHLLLAIMAMALLFTSCKKKEETVLPEKSKDKTITKVIINTNQKVTATIDVAKKTITATVPAGTNLTAITLEITHNGASIAPDPKTPQDFSGGKSAKYTVTAQDGSTQIYTVSIGIEELNGTSTDWKIKDVAGGVQILSYKGKDTKVVIPTTIDNKKVISLENSTFNIFNGNFATPTTNIITIDLSKAIYLISIEKNAFFTCTSLISILMPYSLTSIGNGAFNSCTSLTSIKIPESVTSIGNNAFGVCTSLTSILIPESVTSIGNSAFSGCTSLTSIKIPESITSIGSNVFRNCGLTSIHIPSSVTSIEGNAFFKNKITEVTLPIGCTYKANSFDSTVKITGGKKE